MTLEQFDRLAEVGAAVVSTAPGTPWSVTDVDGTYRDYFASTDSEVFIARPDFVVFGTGAMADAPALVDDMIAQLRSGEQDAAESRSSFAEAGVRRILERGNGASRQRRAFGRAGVPGIMALATRAMTVAPSSAE